LVRIILFWAIGTAAALAFGRYVVPLDFPMIGGRLWGALIATVDSGSDARAAVSALIDPSFAFSLAWAICAVALGLLAAVFVMHAFWIIASLWVLGRTFSRSRSMPEFAGAYDNGPYQRLTSHPLIGHAWKEFDETLVRPEPGQNAPIMNTVRPQSFVNISLAREKLFGLKMMGSIAGYFVGVGLLFTFVGIVLALAQAGEAAMSNNTEDMLDAMARLLHVASFKFATSIAGLGSSIVLSLFFKTFTIWIERAFSHFCELAEQKLRYTAPQSLAAEMNAAIKEQRDELKAINSEQFFANMGKQIAPHIETAFSSAMAPVTSSLSHAVERISQSSQSGAEDLVKRFTEQMKEGAGTELKELGNVLRSMQKALAEVQRDLRGSGQDFAQQMTAAADNLNRLVGEAAANLQAGSAQSRDQLEAIVATLKETFERANQKLDSDLSSAAAGASAKLEGAMGQAMGILESQINNLVAGIGASISRFSGALESAQGALVNQAQAIGESTSQTRQVADAFARTAQDVRTASAPLVEVGERISGATEQMAASISAAVASLDSGQAASRELAQSLVGHIEKLSGMWSGYKQQFDRVDEALGRAVTELARAVEAQGESFRKYTTEVDDGMAKAVSNLKPVLDDLSESALTISEEVENLQKLITRTAAA
jgi:hypothetical protein